MKKIFLLLGVLFLNQAFASGISGVYVNANPECNLQVSIRDFYGTGRDSLVFTTAVNKITEYGANFAEDMEVLNLSGICPKAIQLSDGMGPGFGGEKVIDLKLDDTLCEVKSYELKLYAGNELRDSLKCDNMQKK